MSKSLFVPPLQYVQLVAKHIPQLKEFNKTVWTYKGLPRYGDLCVGSKIDGNKLSAFVYTSEDRIKRYAGFSATIEPNEAQKAQELVKNFLTTYIGDYFPLSRLFLKGTEEEFFNHTDRWFPSKIATKIATTPSLVSRPELYQNFYLNTITKSIMDFFIDRSSSNKEYGLKNPKTLTIVAISGSDNSKTLITESSDCEKETQLKELSEKEVIANCLRASLNYQTILIEQLPSNNANYPELLTFHQNSFKNPGQDEIIHECSGGLTINPNSKNQTPFISWINWFQREPREVEREKQNLNLLLETQTGIFKNIMKCHQKT